MQLADIPRVAEIHVFGWRSAYRGIVPDEHLFNNMTVTKRIEKLTEWLTNPDNKYKNYVYDDGIIKGFLSIGPSRDDDKPQAYELGGLYIEPLFKGQGIGTALAHYCEKIATKEGYDEIKLWTFEKNAPTRAFYEKLGYVPDGKTMIVEPFGAVGVRYGKRVGDLRA